ncbi:MAG: hypothetical protein GXP55_11940 [Deltaproteobacteria bacterium]|nr:hypothetical protein [Deltaproteobacteria bacterium]
MTLSAALTSGASAQGLPPYITDNGLEGNARVAAGYLDATLYDGAGGNAVDPTGVLDSTAGIQAALDDAYLYGMVTYLPAGTYLVSDTLVRSQEGADVVACAEAVRDWGTGYYARRAPSLVGPEEGPRAVLKLMDSSPGFDDDGNPKPIVYFYNDKGSGWDGGPTCGFGFVARNLEIVIGSGNSGAIGLQVPSAQYSTIENIKIDATGGYAGLRGANSTNVVVNLDVTGGRFGVIHSVCCGLAFSGLRLRGQTEVPLVLDTYGAVAIVGFDIESGGESAVRMLSGGSGHTNQVSLVEGVIRHSGSGPVVDNALGKTLYMRNVYIQSDRTLIQSGSETVDSTSLSWQHIREYAYANRRTSTMDGVDTKSYTIIDGVISQAGVTDVVSSDTPPQDLVTRHLPGLLPHFEGDGVLNVHDMGALGDGTTDDRAAIQAAIEASSDVFLPRGDYMISGPIILHANTRIFGSPGMRTRLRPHDSWPLSTEYEHLVQTDDDPNARTVLRDLAIHAPGEPTDDFRRTYVGAVDWRAGRHSIVSQLEINLPRTPRGSDRSSADRRLTWIRGSGGGRWYGLAAHISASRRTRGDDFRLVMVDGTREPLTFYGPNTEKAAQNPHTTILGASNVRVFGIKREGSFSLFRVENSSNIFLASLTAARLNRPFVDLSNSTQVLLSAVALWPAFASTRVGGRSVTESAPDGSEEWVDGPDNVALFHRGLFDDSAFPYCGDGVCDPNNETASCSVDCSVDVNAAPTVDAGADLSVTLGDGASLTGTAADDGLPADPGALSLTWAQVDGPGTAAFSSPTSAATLVSFDAVGVYTLSLSASDGELSASDELQVSVVDGGRGPSPPPPTSCDGGPCGPSASTSGCGCSLAGAERPGALPVLMVALVLLFVIRRRVAIEA